MEIIVKGHMEVLIDQETKNKLWRSNYKVFHKKGMTESEYCILKFTGIEACQSGYCGDWREV